MKLEKKNVSTTTGSDGLRGLFFVNGSNISVDWAVHAHVVLLDRQKEASERF
jgi:hypothetical protein